MILGIVIGLASAVMQSGSYILSRSFMAKNYSAKALTIYSQLIMGVLRWQRCRSHIQNASLMVPVANSFYGRYSG